MINEKLLAKFLMDECTENELCEIKRWMDESNEHAFELFTIEELYQLGKTGFSTRATDVDRAEQMLFKRLKNGRKRKIRELDFEQLDAVCSNICRDHSVEWNNLPYFSEI